MKAIKIFLALIMTSFATATMAQEMPPSLQDALKADDTAKIAHFITKDNINTAFGNYSLLHVSIRSNALKCFALLLAKGADVNLSCNGYVTPLMYAAEYGHLDMAKELVAKGADINYVNHGTVEKAIGKTPITYAEQYKHPEIAEYLRSVVKK